MKMTNEMHRACKSALYRHIQGLPEFSKQHPKKEPGQSCPYVDQRTKRSLRWEATLKAAPKFGADD